MIGKGMYALLDSKVGKKVLESEITDEGLKWSEIGIGRIVFFSSLVTFLGIYGVIGTLATGSPSFSFTTIIVSLYLRVKMTPYMVEVLKEHPKVIELEEKEDFRESKRFKIVRDVINTGEVIESIERHTGEDETTD